MSAVRLVRPAAAHLPSYRAALQRGWGPDNLQAQASAQRELQAMAHDAAAFVAQMHDVQALGGPITLPDGSQVPRIPGFRCWIWEGDDDHDGDGFAGSIGLRWPQDRGALPPHVLGHIGYSVVPWKQRRGHGTAALRLLLPLARAQGLAFVELTTDPDNLPSQRVMLANGAVLLGPFDKGAAYGHKPGLRYRIDL